MERDMVDFCDIRCQNSYYEKFCWANCNHCGTEIPIETRFCDSFCFMEECKRIAGLARSCPDSPSSQHESVKGTPSLSVSADKSVTLGSTDTYSETLSEHESDVDFIDDCEIQCQPSRRA